MSTEGGVPGEGGSDAPVGGPRNPQQIAAQKRVQQSQAQVDEVVDIMRTNVEKVLERDQKLSELDDRADALQHGASQFEQQAGKLKRKFWWKNLKLCVCVPPKPCHRGVTNQTPALPRQPSSGNGAQSDSLGQQLERQPTLGQAAAADIPCARV
ncbi:Synaptobrevin [Amphibalanus amphitrite]|uniref:Synaptobrevin n=1 Tax=Amphibalanus amphitrite TaxID=1232801 RepID=A0A6A4X4V4_AMPAM|nr:Synaptobrevin [Amphibalanus amphitrite]